MIGIKSRCWQRATTAVGLFLTGCSGADGSAAWQGSMETLPNGAVRITNVAPAGADSVGWRVTPLLTLGEAEGSAEETFGSIAAITVDESGRIYVLDRQTNRLSIFGPDGSFVRSVGRDGGGPGEFTRANGLTWLGQSLLVIDQEGARYSALDPEGVYLRSVQRQLPFYGFAFRGEVVGDRVYELFSVGAGESRRPALIGTRLDAAGDGGLPEQDTVLIPQPEMPPPQSYSVRSATGGMSMSVPFAAGAVYRLAPNGHIWHGYGGEFRIFQTSLAGDTLREIRMEMEPVAVTQAELAEWQASEAVSAFRERGGTLDLGLIPKTKPYFNDIHVAPDGELWVTTPGGEGETRFLVFDAEGRFLSRLAIPGIRRDVWPSMMVRGDMLYFVGRDEMDVQRVYVFRVERTPVD